MEKFVQRAFLTVDYYIRFSLSLKCIFNRRVSVNKPNSTTGKPQSTGIYCKTTPIHSSNDLWPSDVCGVFLQWY